MRLPRPPGSLRPGGTVLILELRAHDETWVRDKLGDRHLGFSDEGLQALLGQAGLVDVRVGVGSRRAGDPFTVLVASGRKPDASASASRSDPRQPHPDARGHRRARRAKGH